MLWIAMSHKGTDVLQKDNAELNDTKTIKFIRDYIVPIAQLIGYWSQLWFQDDKFITCHFANSVSH